MMRNITQKKKHTPCFMVISGERSGFVVCQVVADDILTRQPSKYQSLEQHVYAEKHIALHISQQLDIELTRLNKYGFSDDELPKDLRGLY